MTAEPRDVEEIRGDIEPVRKALRFIASPPMERLLDDVEPLLDRLAAADRENAELRGELRASTETGIKSAQVTIDLLRERDDLRAQLAAAQAQLARLLRIFDGINDAIHNETLTEFSRLVAVSALKNVALSAAPQPEPDDGCAECTESGTRNCVAGCNPRAARQRRTDREV